MVQEYKQQRKDLHVQDDFPMSDFDLMNVRRRITEPSVRLSENASYSQLWSDYVVKLSRVLCSFLATDDVKSHHGQGTTSRVGILVSSVYGDLSIKWVMRVLLTVFPCVKACSNENELPSHLRIFVTTMQHCLLNAFRRVLVSFPASLEVFREEGIWDLIFSENFFYFVPALEEFSKECCSYSDGYSTSNSSYSHARSSGVEVLQMEIISLVEFAATSIGVVHNLPESSALLDALEQSAYNPEIAGVLAKSLLRILQLSAEKTISSFKTLDAVPRVLKVACIQAEESRSPELASMHGSVHGPLYGVLESLRNNVLKYILDLMKIVPLTDEDRTAMLQLCSKYLEMFTHIKEQEKSFAALSIDLLVGMRDMISNDRLVYYPAIFLPATSWLFEIWIFLCLTECLFLQYYQALFRDGECFLHVVSLLNGNLDEANGEKLVLNVLQTLTCLLSSSDASKDTVHYFSLLVI
ncbi:hypothetical protein Patl1_08678 [Pistacia atlantica]|uniref:Uncharacterized protein n=1 Tax=Pistacia atlantica TaxID=434234 RepID=A0ACC1AFS8_9ROSI|nr:hypothetical protein Patl1_08678 [Pistacia atlantica]